MRKRVIAACMVSFALWSPGCAWLGRGSKDTAPEKLYTDKPCSTECCCTTKKGYYLYFRCMERAPCEAGGGTCERPDLARCSDE